MTAEKMFEKLGFNLHVDDELCKIYKIKHDKNGHNDDPFNWNYVCFNKDNKTYDVDTMIDGVDIKLHKAINKQCEELGWIDE